MVICGVWSYFFHRVDIYPEEDQIHIRKAIVRQLEQKIGIYLFDGSMLFMTNRLHPDPLELMAKKLPPRGVKGVIYF